ncbi:MAG TPA: hypothetical protein VL132_23900, partial [Planctomycetaceae bacterium]|nr:hypothetical protein [Planctomycetaceae bacterium]
WQPVSPHFTHHGSLSAIEEIDRIARLTNAPNEEVLQISRRALEHLRQDEIGPADAVINQWWNSRRHLAE